MTNLGKYLRILFDFIYKRQVYYYMNKGSILKMRRKKLESVMRKKVWTRMGKMHVKNQVIYWGYLRKIRRERSKLKRKLILKERKCSSEHR